MKLGNEVDSYMCVLTSQSIQRLFVGPEVNFAMRVHEIWKATGQSGLDNNGALPHPI